MFVTKLAKVPRSEILNLLPQIRVVKAFQESVKKSKTEKNSLEEKKEDIKDSDNRFACFIQTKDESPEKKGDDNKEEEECRRKRRGSDDEDDGDDVCSFYVRKKEGQEEKSKERKAVGTQMSPQREARSISAYEMSPHNEQKARSAYEMSFGNRKYRK